MIFVLGLLSSVSLIISLTTGEKSLIVVNAFIIFLLLFIVWHDFRAIRLQLRLLLKDSKRKPSGLPLLSDIAELSDVLEIVNARVNNLENEVAVVSGRKTPVSKGNKSTDDWLLHELRQVASRFHGAAVAVVLPQGETVRFESSLPLGKRFEGQLLGLVESWMQRGDKWPLGARDALTDKGFWGDFSVYGYVGYVLEPLIWKDATDAEVRGALWIGFNAGNTITRLLQETITTEANALETQIVQYMRISSLEERAKQAEEKNNNKSEFITHMSHDIRSPLNNVKAIFHLLQNEGEQTQETKDILRAGLLSCENVSEMLETLLDYSKLKAGKLGARMEDSLLNSILAQSAIEFDLSAKAKQLTLSYVCKANAEAAFAHLDRRQLKRILFNLISNAIKYTDRGFINLSLGTEDADFIITIADSGRGMAKEQFAKLFLPFERLENDTVDGVGIGLMLTKALVELNKGSIAIDSVIGQGTTVTIRFTQVLRNLPGMEDIIPHHPKPITDSNISPIPIAPAPHEIAVEKSSRTILLVDDDLLSSNSLKKLLERFGFEVMVAGGVAEALSIIGFQKPDVVVSDVGMPEGGGEQLLRDIKNRYPNIPVLLLTGERDTQKLKALLNGGAQTVLEKPLNFSLLRTAIEAATQT